MRLPLEDLRGFSATNHINPIDFVNLPFSTYPIPIGGAVKTVEIVLEPDDGSLYFSVYLWGNLHPSIPKIRKHIGWEKWGDDRGCYSPIRLLGNRNDIPRMVDHAISAFRALGRAIRRYA